VKRTRNRAPRPDVSRRRVALGAIVLAAAVQACTVGPDYERPVVDMPDVWQDRAVEGVEKREATLQTWWDTLDDPVLIDLIARAEQANLDLRQAVGRIREARAQRRVVTGERYPDVNAGAEVNRTDPSDNLLPIPGGIDANTFYSAGFDATWEIDVFGRIRRSVESATASYEASVEDYRDVLVTLFAEVARNYIDARALQKRIDFAEANVETQQETLQLTQDRFAAGLVSALDVAQAESNLASSDAAIPRLETQLTAALNRLAVLLGEAPGELDYELEAKRQIPVLPDEVAVGLPADLLRQRPDVRRAERDLAAQTARIGVATADLYPRFSLTGFLGLQSTSGGEFFSANSVGWSLGLPMFANIFDGGRVRGRIDIEKARTEQLLAFYEQSVLLALEDVETSVAAYANERERRKRLQRAVDATERSVDLVQTQYKAGLTDFQNVLDSERSLFNRQDELAESEGDVVKNLIALYKALGGGWAVDENEPETYTSGITTSTGAQGSE